MRKDSTISRSGLKVKTMRYLSVFLTFFLINSTAVTAQNTIGIPRIINYTKEVYRAGTQVWDITQDRSGRMYFANDEGLLTFDGHFWKLHPLPNKTNMRSIAITEDGRIYAGGQGELGYFLPDPSGRLQYTSLIPLLPATERSFADIWDIEVMGESVFFRVSDRRILQYRNEHFTSFPAASAWLNLKKCGQKLWAHDREKGLFILKIGRWQPVAGSEKIGNRLVSGIFERGNGRQTILLDDLTALTLTNELLQPDPTFAGRNPKGRIFRAESIKPGGFAVSTISEGCLILDENGGLLQQLSRKEGLQDNNVISVFQDRDGNLWAGLNNGISFIAYNAAIKYIRPNPDNDVSGYSTRIFGDRLFIASSDGVYQTPVIKGSGDLSFSRNAFRRVGQSDGQTWRIEEVNGQLLIAHTLGMFRLDPVSGQAVRISNSPGWLFVPLSPVSPSEHIITGTYGGLRHITFRDGIFRDMGDLQGTYESLRFLTLDNNGEMWASHPYRGIYRIRLDLSRKTYQTELMTDRQGLPSTLGNHVFKVRNQIVFGTTKGVFSFDGTTGKFNPDPFFDSVLGNREVRYLNEDEQGRIWFCSGKDLGVIAPDKSGGKTGLTFFPELRGRILSGFENVYAHDGRNVFIGSEKGVIHIDFEKYRAERNKPGLLLSLAKASGKTDSLLFDGYSPASIVPDRREPIPNLPGSFDAYHFEYSATAYAEAEYMEYSYRLDGYDRKWSEWSTKTEKDYTNLSFGRYRFRVKARNSIDTETNEAGFAFTILPPWYMTVWAWLLYIAAGVAAVVTGSRYQRRKLLKQQLKFEEKQRQMEIIHQLEMEKNEKEIIRLQNEKLENEILLKTRELADTSLHLVERNEALLKVKESLQRLYRDTPQGAHDLKRTLQLINEVEKNDDSWDKFASHFDEVNSNFLRNLRQAHPKLSNTDMKLCAYLELNLASKEIAQLMNISVRGVEIGRYRLRKKLRLESGQSLQEFLEQYRDPT
jgi:ligand-binding sensor domain-containing protein/DNA-binding CsgD family transcriptional regulator